jgi:hypothetical protein
MGWRATKNDMIGYLLKISAGEDSSEISLKGSQVDCSGAAGITRKNTRNLATLYYGSDFFEDDVAILKDIEKIYIPQGSIKHHDSTWPIEVRAIGQYIFEKLMPKSVCDAIRNLPSGSLIKLEVSDDISHVPWELMYTGRNFLCLEHILGRVPATIKETYEPVNGPIPMLMIANPTGDLIGSQNEANYIISQLRGSNLRISRYGSEIRKNDYIKLLESGKYSIVHYSGHSARSTELWKSCHVFLDDLCYGYEIEALKMKNPPRLVFSNSCESAEGSLNKNETGNTSLSGSYLKAGVGGCVGTIWNVSDVGSSNFASDFYRYLLFGATLGEALLNARKAAFKRWGYNNLIWGSYILFGDPEIRLVKKG